MSSSFSITGEPPKSQRCNVVWPIRSVAEIAPSSWFRLLFLPIPRPSTSNIFILEAPPFMRHSTMDSSPHQREQQLQGHFWRHALSPLKLPTMMEKRHCIQMHRSIATMNPLFYSSRPLLRLPLGWITTAICLFIVLAALIRVRVRASSLSSSNTPQES